MKNRWIWLIGIIALLASTAVSWQVSPAVSSRAALAASVEVSSVVGGPLPSTVNVLTRLLDHRSG